MTLINNLQNEDVYKCTRKCGGMGSEVNLNVTV